MNSHLFKDKLNTWLKASKILFEDDFNILVGNKSIPALSLFFIFSKILEISEEHVGQTYIEGKEGALKYSEKVVSLEGRESTSFFNSGRKMIVKMICN